MGPKKILSPMELAAWAQKMESATRAQKMNLAYATWAQKDDSAKCAKNCHMHQRRDSATWTHKKLSPSSVPKNLTTQYAKKMKITLVPTN